MLPQISLDGLSYEHLRLLLDVVELQAAAPRGSWAATLRNRMKKLGVHNS